MAKSDGIELDGDCFYNSVRCAVWGSRKNPTAGETVPSVKQLRDVRCGCCVGAVAERHPSACSRHYVCTRVCPGHVVNAAQLVANEMGKEQLEFYQMMEQLTRTRSG